MAGGMRSRRTSAIPLHMRGVSGPDSTPAPAPLPAPPPRQRHCWVQHPFGGEVEGLIVEWNRHERGWRALVTYVDGDQLVTRWAPAEALRPA